MVTRSGYLSIRLALDLRDKGKPLPGVLVSASPWLDLSLSGKDLVENAETDKLLSVPVLEMFRDSWIGGTEYTFDDPRFSVLHADLTGLPPTSLHWGTAEILAGEGESLGQRLQEFGVDNEVVPLEDGQHSFVMAAGKVPEVDAAVERMGRWIRTKLKISPSPR